MIFYPFVKQFFLMIAYQYPNPSQVRSAKSIILPEFYRLQEDNDVHSFLRHMDMGWLVIIWIYCNIIAMFLSIKYFNHIFIPCHNSNILNK